MTQPRTAVVAGAGVFGAVCALSLVEAGLTVTLMDPGGDAQNASSIAAGMLAPVGEALFDPASLAHYPLMHAASLAWPFFAKRYGLALDRGAIFLGDPIELRRQAPGVHLETASQGLFSNEDLRVVEPSLALSKLMAAFEQAGGQVERAAFLPTSALNADIVVLATGNGGGALSGFAPELVSLQPVKGQLAVLPSGPKSGPTLRWDGGYLAPQPSGALVGGTMEYGRANVVIDPAAIAAMVDLAKTHLPSLDVSGAYGKAGVRVQTPDALPLVGPSRANRTFLATGARRNGWLFAPLVGAMVAAYVMGKDPSEWAAALHPARFEKT